MSEILTTAELLASTAEPKRKFRWVIGIAGIDGFTAVSTKRPSGGFGETTIDFVNTKRYLSGKFTPEMMDLTLWDPIAPSAAQKIMEWVRLNYEIVTGRMGYSDFYKKDLSLKLLDPPGGVAESWSVKGAWIKSFDMGDLQYNSEDIVSAKLQIRYDTAVLLY